jgi:ketol-acid reductoisomerase
MRDNGLQVIVGNRDDSYTSQAIQDGFEVFDIPTAVSRANVVFLLLPDEVLKPIFRNDIFPSLRVNSTLVFASGYNVAFDQITLPTESDVLLIAPRMIGVGVRERFLTEEGFYCLVGVHQDHTGSAQEDLLALTKAVGGLRKPAIEVTFKQEALLDLFNEQAFGPAFGRVLLSAISVLLEKGLPPEAVLVEMYLSEEMAYTYRKMADVGLVKQTLYHSPTSQYGALSRGVRFLDLDLKKRMRAIYEEIDRGDFAREWAHPFARIKFKVIRFFALRQAINRVEKAVRKTLGLQTRAGYAPPDEAAPDLDHPEIQKELQAFKDTFEF